MQDIHPKIRHRVTNALKEAVDAINKANETQAEEPMESSRIKDCFKCLCFPNHSPFQKKTSKHLSNARIIGAKMIPTIIFPATPQLFRDTWVFFELLFAIIQFIFGLISTNYRSNRLYNAFYISLSIVSIILSVIDAFLHYYQLGSCKLLFTRCKKRLNSNQEDLQVENDTKRKEIIMDDVTDTQMKRCCHLSVTKKKLFNTWFEVIRTILSELLLYPLVILDLFEIVGNQRLRDQINFSLFIVGSLYFVLTVYIARVVISALTLLTVKRLLSESKTNSSNIRFILRFLIHIIAQVIVHISIVIAVGIKIRQENSAGNNYTASPILWAVVIGGWVIPFLGAVSFFNVNYYWMQQFATGIYVEMISLLQTPSVADSLFQSKSEMSLEHSKHFLENMQHKKVQKEYEQEVNTTSRFSKLIYPLKIPLFISFCILYNLFLGTFFACLFLTYDDGNVSVVSLDDYQGIILVIMIIFITLGNIHIVLLTLSIFVIMIIAVTILSILPGMCLIITFIALLTVAKQSRQTT